MRKYLLLITLSFFIQNSFAQLDKSKDSLSTKSFKYLKERIESEDLNIEERKIYIDAYLNKAKTEKDTIEIGNGFYFKAVFYPLENNEDDNMRGLKYADSMIYYTKNLDHKTYPGFGYILRGYYYLNLSKEKRHLMITL